MRGYYTGMYEGLLYWYVSGDITDMYEGILHWYV
jgi:hypothetical protein